MTDITYPTFPAVRNMDLFYRLLLGWSDRHHPLIPYRRLIPPVQAEMDDVHREVPEYKKRWEPDIQLRAYCLPSDQSHPMTIFGIEELRDVVLFVAVPCLLREGLAVQDASRRIALSARTGDRFVYSGGVEYDVLEWRIGKTYANTDIPMEFQAIAERVRPEASEFMDRALDG